MFIGIGLRLIKWFGDSTPVVPSTSQLLIQDGTDALLIEGGSDALLLQA